MTNKPISFSLTFILLVSGIFILDACSFSAKTTEKYFENAKTKSYDMIAVPGVPFTENGWDRTMKARVYWSKYLYDLGISKNIMYSGSSVYSPYYEGEIMVLYAIAIGIPKEHVFAEIKAEHSTENLFYVVLKSKKMGFKSFALATDPFQAKQLKRFARIKFDEPVALIPIVFDTLRSLQPHMLNPQIDFKQAYNSQFIPLKSRESFWKRLKGTMGKNINRKAYD